MIFFFYEHTMTLESVPERDRRIDYKFKITELVNAAPKLAGFLSQTFEGLDFETLSSG